MNWRSGYNEKQLRGGRPKCQTEAAGNVLLEQGPGGRWELGPALPGSWQNGSCPGESSGEVMPWWNLGRVWSYLRAKDWRRKERANEASYVLMDEKQWRASSQTAEWQSRQVPWNQSSGRECVQTWFENYIIAWDFLGVCLALSVLWL